MSQHDMTLDNASGLGFRTDGECCAAGTCIAELRRVGPKPTFPCQVWGDTGTGRLKQRNAANSAWLDKGPLDATLRDAASQSEFVADTGAANAYVCNFVPAITARSESTPIRFKAANTNSGACTINDGLGTVALVGGAHTALKGGEIFANGIAWIQWNSSVGGGSYVLLFCTGGLSQAQLRPPGMQSTSGSSRRQRPDADLESAVAGFPQSDTLQWRIGQCIARQRIDADHPLDSDSWNCFRPASTTGTTGSVQRWDASSVCIEHRRRY